MRWNQFQDTGPAPLPKKRIAIAIRQLGLAKVVFVRTKKNGGINCNRTKIFVKEA